MVNAAIEVIAGESEAPSREQIEANIKALEEAADSAYSTYDRAFRVLGANDAECDEAHSKWMKAQDAWQEAKYQRDMRSYQFAELMGTAGFAIKPQRAHYH